MHLVCATKSILLAMFDNALVIRTLTNAFHENEVVTFRLFFLLYQTKCIKGRLSFIYEHACIVFVVRCNA